jgi:hypothetical protein
MRALLCLGQWSILGLIRDCDVRASLGLDEEDGDEEDLAEGWDTIGALQSRR